MSYLGPYIRAMVVGATFFGAISPILLSSPHPAAEYPASVRVASRPAPGFTGIWIEQQGYGDLTRSVKTTPVFAHDPIYATFPEKAPAATPVIDLAEAPESPEPFEATPVPAPKPKAATRPRKRARLASIDDGKEMPPGDIFGKYCSTRGQLSWMRIDGVKRFCP